MSKSIRTAMATAAILKKIFPSFLFFMCINLRILIDKYIIHDFRAFVKCF
jgi:hypothetical protein